MMATMMAELGLRVPGFVALLCMVTVGSAVVGWVYEMLFYRIDSGGQWVRRGQGVGPWLPIYGFGSLGILFACWGVRASVPATFAVSALVTGGLELACGYVLYHCFDGLRLWDYNTEIWNWGNVGGYICARSVLLFAAAGIAVMRLVVPLATRVILTLGETSSCVLFGALGLVFAADVVRGYLVRKR